MIHDTRAASKTNLAGSVDLFRSVESISPLSPRVSLEETLFPAVHMVAIGMWQATSWLQRKYICENDSIQPFVGLTGTGPLILDSSR
ncbi:hypothetical protein WOLCODRAFT_138682 [Wolfiporia cocos MD-104 SS10]|uniref:Uncharacterized protein n=1 Tax=Wolfiporia cocos (strain MD-104) TaxID=742152 RepID=A0A2H3JP20_WOLCO|nr:hypothetical protein WOLCODRAFT_138682 [Wolfiporia cocos MD-104 SS10]